MARRVRREGSGAFDMNDDPHHEPVDDSEVLREAFEEKMNAKNGGWGPTIVVGLVVGAGSTIISHWLDSGTNKEAVLNNTVTALVEVKTQVSNLADEVKQLREQPYVRREEFESRFTGLEGRVGNIERTEQSRRRQ